ncbi:MAG: cytochrome c oxidase subunit 3 [Armatimonadota bacterium]|nr:cytochrome c oxidase subunit 3 [Armatimonadota bacterium]
MPATPTLREPRVRLGGAGAGVPPSDADGGDGRRGPWSDGSGAGHAASAATIGMWLFVGAVVLLFASFTSTLVVRRAEADWRLGPMPSLLWVNTAVLVASSLALEWARGRGRRGDLRRLGTGLAGATALGVVFLTGQWTAWRQLLAGGVSLATGPHSAFFYLLTGTHALHVAGGIAALAYAVWRVRHAARVQAAAGVAPARAPGVVAPVAIYWHFVDVLWWYVLVVLFV